MKDMNFDLKQIRSFNEIIKENSFTRASRNLKIGQATISHHIQQLEEALGVKLINRTSKSFSITPEGETFLDFCKNVFTQLDELRENLDKSTEGGSTDIAASTIPSTYILPAIISSLRKNNPEYYYRVHIFDSREAVEFLKEGKAELAITGKQVKHPSLEYSLILQDNIVLIGSSSSQKTMQISELGHAPLVRREKGSGTRNATDEALIAAGISPAELNNVYECTTSEGIKESVIEGIGFAFISKLAIRRELDLGILKEIKIEGFEIKRNFYIAFQKNRHLSSPARAFLEAVTDRPQ